MSWTLIEHQALSSSVASVTLGSGGTIPQTYKTLMVLVSARCSGATTGESLAVKINGTTTGNSSRWLNGTGSAAQSGTDSSTTIVTTYGSIPGTNATASTFSNDAITFPNYAGSTAKPVSGDGVSENNATAAYQSLAAGLQTSTSAITSLVFTPYSGSNFVSGSTFTLYGLA